MRSLTIFAVACLLVVSATDLIFAQHKQCYNPQPETLEERREANRLNIQGAVYYKNKQANEAFESFGKTVRLFPNNAEAWNNLGIGYAYILKKPLDAIPLFEKAICLNPQLATAYYSLGTVYLNVGNYQDSIPYLQTALQLEPGKISTLNNLAVVFIKKKDYRKASELIESALRKNPDDYILLNNFASVQFYQKKFKDAQNTFQKAIGINTEKPTAQFNLGVVFLKLKDKDAAIKQYSILKQIDEYWSKMLYQGIYQDKILFLSEPQSY